MDNYFMMSFKFNKSTPEDFWLVSSENENIFTRLSDKTFWEKCYLYDFGWGKENGFRRIPCLKFSELVNLILHSTSNNDKYGAANEILEKHTNELLVLCHSVLKEEKQAKQYLDFFRILNLDEPINRSSVIGKTYLEVSNDYMQWVEISKILSNYT